MAEGVGGGVGDEQGEGSRDGDRLAEGRMGRLGICKY